MDDCFISLIARQYTWVLIDLGHKFFITEIIFHCQPNGGAVRYCSDILFKVGNTTDASKMNKYGEFVGPGENNQRTSLRSETPILGQYVYGERFERIQICHLEVKGSVSHLDARRG